MTKYYAKNKFTVRIPPTAVGGSFKSNLQQGEPTARNPTHGSGWIVQVQPTTRRPRDSSNPTHGSGWIIQVQPTARRADGQESHPREWVDRSSPPKRE